MVAALSHVGLYRFTHSPTRIVRLKARSSSVKQVGLDTPVDLQDGKPVSGPDLSINVNGMNFPNPFVIGSGPPGVQDSFAIRTTSPAFLRLTETHLTRSLASELQEQTIGL